MKGETPANAELVEAMARALARDLIRQDGYEDQPEEVFHPGELSWPYIDQGKVDFGEIATACLQALSQAGWVVVRREPSEAMLQGACDKHTPGVPMGSEGYSNRECPRFETRRNIWRKMIAASAGEG